MREKARNTEGGREIKQRTGKRRELDRDQASLRRSQESITVVVA